jgi:hypothetical protein
MNLCFTIRPRGARAWPCRGDHDRHSVPPLFGIKHRVEVGVSRVHPRGADRFDFLLGEFGGRKATAVLSNAPERGTRYGVHAGHAASLY